MGNSQPGRAAPESNAEQTIGQSSLIHENGTLTASVFSKDLPSGENDSLNRAILLTQTFAKIRASIESGQRE